jgi:hypothetical protein
VDILGPADQNVVSSIVNFVSGSTASPQIDSHFMSESGIIDTFFMLGPNPKDVFRQYRRLTGSTPLPQASEFCFANWVHMTDIGSLKFSGSVFIDFKVLTSLLDCYTWLIGK